MKNECLPNDKSLRLYTQISKVTLTDIIANGDSKFSYLNLLSSDKQLVFALPVGFIPKTSWNTVLYFKQVDNTYIYFRSQGSIQQNYEVYVLIGYTLKS